MHIVLIAHVFGFNDGQGRVNYEIAREAVRHGLSITLVGEHCAEDLRRAPGVRFVHITASSLPSRFLKNVLFAKRSARWLTRHRQAADVVQANGFVTFAQVDVAAAHFVHGAWLNSPYSSNGANNNLLRRLYQRIYTRLNARLEQGAFHRARRIVAVSARVASELASVGVDPSRIVTIFNGVDVEEFSPRCESRAQFSLPHGVPLFLFAGDLRTTRKNLDTVLRALVSLPQVHLAVAGATAGSPYPALAESLGVADRVHFVGRTSAMNNLMASADAFVFPSRYDPLGLVVLEAMATGLPVITARTTGASAILDDPDWTLEDPDDVQRLTRMMGTLTQDPALRRRLGERNRQTALHHTWSAMASRYLDLFAALGPSSPNEMERGLPAATRQAGK